MPLSIPKRGGEKGGRKGCKRYCGKLLRARPSLLGLLSWSWTKSGGASVSERVSRRLDPEKRIEKKVSRHCANLLEALSVRA